MRYLWIIFEQFLYLDRTCGVIRIFGWAEHFSGVPGKPGHAATGGPPSGAAAAPVICSTAQEAGAQVA